MQILDNIFKLKFKYYYLYILKKNFFTYLNLKITNNLITYYKNYLII